MQVDVAVIGGGPGGYVAAIKAAQQGKKVAVIEKADLGGVCLNWGCIPTKTLLRSAEILSLIKKKSALFGIHVNDYAVDFSQVIQKSRQVANRLAQGVTHLMKKNNIEVVYGSGRFIDKNHIQVCNSNGDRHTITSEYTLVATGASARPFPGVAKDDRIITSREAMVLEQIPPNIAIVGAGAIGIEFAYFFQTFGAQVTVLEMLPHILPQEDEDIARELTRSLKKQGIKIITGAKIESVERLQDGANIFFAKKGQQQTLPVDYVLLAIGVEGNSQNLGLETLGITTENGWIKTDDYYRTSVANIYAIGDVIGPPWLAHAASAEGVNAVNHICGKEVTPINYLNVPGCTYCHPQVASVGYTEKQAMEAGYTVKIGKFPMRANGKALALGEEEGLVKVIYDEKYGELLGCHIIGPEATEIINEITIARTLEATYAELLHTVHPHPTITESLAEATWNALGQSLHV